MNHKNYIIPILLLIIVFLYPVVDNAKDFGLDDVAPKVIEISQGYRIPDDKCYLGEVLPTLDVAFKVALPILQARYKNSFERNMPFKGYLLNDSVWVIYGSMPRLVEGGFPYIELSKRDGRVIKITHTK